MNPLFETLKNEIAGEAAAYKALLKLAKQKKDILVSNKTSALNDIVLQEQEILGSIKQHAQTREDCVAKAAESFGVASETLHFQAIIDLTQGGVRQDFISLRTALADTVAELSEINALNKTLIETHMKYVSFCIEAVASHIKGLGTYSNAGCVDSQKADGHMLLDRTV